MIVSYATTGPKEQLTVWGEIDGFEHNCTVGADLAKTLTNTEVLELAERLITEAHERYLSEQP